MAFGFIKKVFSFGKKQVEEQAPEEAAETAEAALQAEEPGAPATDGAGPSSDPSGPLLPTGGEERTPAETPVPPVEESDAPPTPPSPRSRGEGEDEGQREGEAAVPSADGASEGTGPSSDPSGHLLPAGGEKGMPAETPVPPVEERDTSPTPPSPRERGEGEDEGRRDGEAAAPSSDDASEGAGPSSDPSGHLLPAGGEKGTPAETSAPKAEELDAPPTPPSPRERGEGEDEGRREDEAPAAKVTVSKSVEQKREATPEAAPEPRKPWFQRLREGLSRSSRELRDNIAGVFTKRKLDEDTLQDLEDVLLRADLGLETAMRVTDALAAGRYGKDVSGDEVQAVMAEEIGKVLAPVALPLELDLSHKPHVILVVGVNGTGKTTTIGKLAAKLVDGGLKVTLGAGDTFRAAAIEQLKIWGERTGSPVVSSKLGADAAGLAWDAYDKAKETGSDVLIIDTAGRLQNKAELMAELEKIVRVLGKHDPEAPHTVLQTVDATTGQNALNQVEIFRNVAGVNGLVMTKLDGTARGGILVSIAAKHKLPVYFIGVGEQIEDLEPFSASDFAKAIAGVSE